MVLEGHTRDVQSAAFSPDGTRVVTASRDATALIWSADTDVLSSAVNLNGTWVVTSDDQTARSLSRLNTRALTAALWTATHDCLSVEERRDYLGATDDEASAQIASCKREVSESQPHEDHGDVNPP